MDARSKKRLFLAARVLISAGLLGALFLNSDLRGAARLAAGIQPAWFGASLLLVGLSVLLSAWKWQLLLDAQEVRLGLPTLSGNFASGLFFNNFLPSSIGGDGVRILLVSRQTGRPGEAASSVVVDRLLASLALGGSGLAASLAASHPAAWIRLVLLGLALAAGLLILAVIAGRAPAFLTRRGGRVARAVTAFLQAGARLRLRRRALAASLGVSILFQISVAAVVAGVMAALGLPALPWPDLIYVTAASSVLAMVPLGINGYGLREAAFVYLLGPCGIGAASALAVSILFALTVSTFSLGGAVTWLVQRPASGRLHPVQEG
jgi:uncharacterized membrane protein YbhN (UPF0104 family)